MTFWHSGILYSACFSKIWPLASTFGLLRRKKPADGYPQAWNDTLGLDWNMRFVRWCRILQKLLYASSSPETNDCWWLLPVHPKWLSGALLPWGSTPCSTVIELEKIRNSIISNIRGFVGFSCLSVGCSDILFLQLVNLLHKLGSHYSCGMDERLRKSLQASTEKTCK